jgi:AcrR family transcriptional regulator
VSAARARRRGEAGRVVTSAASRTQVAEIQRSRLFGACVGALEDLGCERTTVADITGRSRVSRRTFYDLFANREDCVVALLEDIVARVSRELAGAGLDGLGWRERMRGGLWVVLCFFDREPALARTLVVHAAQGGGGVFDTREAILARLVSLIDEGRAESTRGAQASELTAEGVLGAVLAIAHTRLLREVPLSGLLGELSALVVLPYLGPAAARRERQRAAPAPVCFSDSPQPVLAGAQDPLAGLPMRVTYRTARVLEGVGRRPGASNRQVGEYAGIADAGQISKLLARLQRLGLLENRGGGRAKGAANAWALSSTGVQVARSLGGHGEAIDGRGGRDGAAHDDATGRAVVRQRNLGNERQRRG